MSTHDVRREGSWNNQSFAWVQHQPTPSRGWITAESSTCMWILIFNFSCQNVKRLWDTGGSGCTVCYKSIPVISALQMSWELIPTTHCDMAVLFILQAGHTMWMYPKDTSECASDIHTHCIGPNKRDTVLDNVEWKYKITILVSPNTNGWTVRKVSMLWRVITEPVK